ncbi:hypothetical protein K2173_011604 [Erythroxylum novogranatense]|uniref:Bifunctional inhibitor/plant lipid transfer protein/seed storage helical domain-containing protein n=1 Tax=Erythroxylum novogranatense TaxID=1862640 RepID=A0AAV8U505_9ROSI|nr:hypothetical protein K2173_011604 [Erythroxylum novogranatense]
MKRMVGCGFMFMFLLLLVSAKAAVTCDEAITSLLPCLPYLIGTNNDPAPTCCIAVKSLNDQASTTPIRRDLCYCFQNAAKSFHVNPEKAKSLPDLCHVQVPVPIDPNVDCSKIQ